MRIMLTVLFLASGCNHGGTTVTEPEAEPSTEKTEPRDYCEAIVDSFCPFYVRCGRMAVPDVETCRSVFIEQCNAVYEPIYVGLADAGLLALDPEGIESCAAHLGTVDCEEQIFDLDGACGSMWIGQSESGSTCGLGIESFVCAPGNDCVLTPELCGTCQPRRSVGEDCDEDNRCAQSGQCVGGVCVARALPGMPCGQAGCVLGARCVDDVCAGPQRSAVGESCANLETCPYKSDCIDGLCVEANRLGQSCGDDQTCASNVCTDGVCVAPSAAGVACENGSTCVSGVCSEGMCAPLPGQCFGD